MDESPDPTVAEAPKPEKAKIKDRKVHLAKRSASIAKKYPDLPAALNSPFFANLLERWKEPPTIASPVSQMCTTSQFSEPDYKRICDILSTKPRLHRKQWEFVYIYRCVEQAGLISRKSRGLAFGVGREKLPSAFIAGGCKILATDLPAAEATGSWVGGMQHTDSVDKLFHPSIVEQRKFYRKASFRPVNMNAIPDDLEGFAFCWSSCALEHLGSLKHGLDFIRGSLKCLRPGGLAVHTTEFNLGSDTETLETGPSVVYRESDLQQFAEEMRSQGHSIGFNLHPGTEPTDVKIDRFRSDDIHLRLYASHKIPATSVGLSIRKAE